jgi:hypothetical protein
MAVQVNQRKTGVDHPSDSAETRGMCQALYGQSRAR